MFAPQHKIRVPGAPSMRGFTRMGGKARCIPAKATNHRVPHLSSPFHREVWEPGSPSQQLFDCHPERKKQRGELPFESSPLPSDFSKIRFGFPNHNRLPFQACTLLASRNPRFPHIPVTAIPLQELSWFHLPCVQSPGRLVEVRCRCPRRWPLFTLSFWRIAPPVK
jgi:hypothetical protein